MVITVDWLLDFIHKAKIPILFLRRTLGWGYSRSLDNSDSALEKDDVAVPAAHEHANSVSNDSHILNAAVAYEEERRYQTHAARTRGPESFDYMYIPEWDYGKSPIYEVLSFLPSMSYGAFPLQDNDEIVSPFGRRRSTRPRDSESHCHRSPPQPEIVRSVAAPDADEVVAPMRNMA